MSEVDMEKKYVVGRQSPAPSQRDAGCYATNKYGRPSATARKEFGGSSRPVADHAAAASRRQHPVAQQPRNRFCDNRPRPRGPYCVDQKEEVTSGELSVPEYGSVQTWGSKKSNMNHLLNFHYESRDLYNSSRFPSATHMRGSDMKMASRRFAGRGSVPYNKERFLQANCQFVVRAGKDYAVHAIDPDTLVDWDLIEQVRISSHEVPSCPICLFAPKAAKITRCGHIYCWPCMLHYLSLDERTWRKCPICYEAVHEKDLKSVTALETHQYVVGDKIEMKLMKKLRGSTRVGPALDWSPDGCFPNKLRGAAKTCFSKLLIADVEDIQGILSIERRELEQELMYESDSTLEGSFISAALKSLEVREQTLKVLESIDSQVNSLVAVDQCMIAPDETVASSQACKEPVVNNLPKVDQFYLSAFDETLNEEILVESQHVISSSGDSDDDKSVGDEQQQQLGELLQDLEMLQVEDPMLVSDGNNGEAAKDDAFYFYQAADGQHIYMHSLNVRCMVKQYGSLQNCPDTIQATILEMEPVSMDEELRRRMRYLNHLPLTCEFIMAELDLKPPVVSQQVLDEFAENFEKRSRERFRKAREDKKRAYRIQAEENRKMGIDPTMRIIRSDYGRQRASAVTSFEGADELGVAPQSARPDELTENVSSSRGPRTESTSSQDSSCNLSSSVPSFAQMLKAGKVKVDAWPKTNKATTAGADCGANAGIDEYESLAPRHQNSLSDAIQAALDNYTKESSDYVSSDQPASQLCATASAAGKKKKVKKLLFSTSLPRGK